MIFPLSVWIICLTWQLTIRIHTHPNLFLDPKLTIHPLPAQTANRLSFYDVYVG